MKQLLCFQSVFTLQLPLSLVMLLFCFIIYKNHKYTLSFIFLLSEVLGSIFIR